MQDSIALTWSTLTARLKNLRAGAACAGLLVLALILSALFLRSGWVLAGLPALMLLGYAFFRRDAALIYRWEDAVLARWGASDLCMGILVQTFRDHPGPLKATLQGMIASLPPNPDFLTPSPDAIKAERALFYARSGMQRARLARAATLNIALASLPVCAWLCHRHDARLLPLGLVPLVLVPPVRALILAREMKRLRARCAALAPWNPAAVPDLLPRLQAVDSTGMPSKAREAWNKTIMAASA
jgi:hypothetical protein